MAQKKQKSLRIFNFTVRVSQSNRHNIEQRLSLPFVYLLTLTVVTPVVCVCVYK